MRSKLKRLFPMDFYGQDGRWRFAVRASHPHEVIDACYWQAKLSIHRDQYDLLSIADFRFSYEYQHQPEHSSIAVSVKMVGPVVSVSNLIAL